MFKGNLFHKAKKVMVVVVDVEVIVVFVDAVFVVVDVGVVVVVESCDKKVTFFCLMKKLPFKKEPFLLYEKGYLLK